MLDIRNKWALVTGASRGVGLQVACALASRGCNLVVHSRKKEHTAPEAQQLSKNVKVIQLEAELSDTEAVKEMAEKAEQLSGGIDILYNNAAIMTAYRTDIYSATHDEYLKSFLVNTIAPITICNIIIPQMIKRGFGRVVNVTSGIKDEPQLMPYAASKAALDKFVFDMANHLKGTGVLMNLMDPGWLRTDLGGPNAPNPVESVLPGALVPVLLEEQVCGKLFRAQDFR
ncbi:MAG: SDR family oxidoreductase [Fibrobacter sp.]|jgi:3-oxoacyl-[acyl-carrier protein] reductase|nr:SDR family oxidoreductase [Fibrobacter sp.]